MKPQWHPYLFLIFFATLFEYNLHRFITVVTHGQALKSDKHKWVREHLYGFYWLVFISVLGFVVVAFLAKKEVLIALAPIAAITLFYSLPVFEKKRTLFRLREIPFLKIFLIAFVWSSSTILLPVIHSGQTFGLGHVLSMLAERFLFVLAITIPFDIRDMEADKQAGLKTLPLLLSENRSLAISYWSLLAFFLLSFFHYGSLNHWHVVVALGISAATTFVFLRSEKIRNLPYYHYGILDGSMILQGVLVLFSVF
jgi:4-hydroxybenzoate polyprenyltransferase